MSPRPPRPPKDRPPGAEAPDAPWRLFIAVRLPPEVQELVAALTAELAANDWPIRWMGADGAHLTLHFLGETAPERAELVRLALPAVVAGHAAFTLRTAGLGVFPNQRRPRVLWLGLYGPVHRLETLQRDIGGVLRGLDFPVEDGPFNPHITLGRVRASGTPSVSLRALPDVLRRLLAERAAGAPGAPPVQPLPVREIELVRSHLGRGRPHYETVARYPLATVAGARR